MRSSIFEGVSLCVLVVESLCDSSHKSLRTSECTTAVNFYFASHCHIVHAVICKEHEVRSLCIPQIPCDCILPFYQFPRLSFLLSILSCFRHGRPHGYGCGHGKQLLEYARISLGKEKGKPVRACMISDTILLPQPFHFLFILLILLYYFCRVFFVLFFLNVSLICPLLLFLFSNSHRIKIWVQTFFDRKSTRNDSPISKYELWKTPRSNSENE